MVPRSQKAVRKVTPDQEPIPINQDGSRDELAGTFSGHQGRRRKRVIDEDETDDEGELPSPIVSIESSVRAI